MIQRTFGICNQESGKRLNFRSFVCAEEVERDGCLSGLRPPEDTPEARTDKTASSGTSQTDLEPQRKHR